MDNIQFFHGNEALIDEIQPLWEALNRHHELVSPHFKGDFHGYTFQQRKTKLLDKYQFGKLCVYIARDQDQAIGYVISGVSEDGLGEIESIFIREAYRRQALGDELMKRAMKWLSDNQPHSIVVDVTVGNKLAYPFYARYGFFPRVTRLKQKVA
jgi:ribosomal protein S18 acetylase RimI-like enzyme